MPCLLEAYDDTFKLCAAARRSRVPYTLTFRRAPFHKGWLRKKSRGRSSSRFSGLTGWKRRFFVLRSGKLTYYEAEPPSASPGRNASKPKGSFSLARQCTVRIRETDGVLELALTAANDRNVRGRGRRATEKLGGALHRGDGPRDGRDSLCRTMSASVSRGAARGRAARAAAPREPGAARECSKRQASERASLVAAQARRTPLLVGVVPNCSRSTSRTRERSRRRWTRPPAAPPIDSLPPAYAEPPPRPTARRPPRRAGAVPERALHTTVRSLQTPIYHRKHNQARARSPGCTGSTACPRPRPGRTCEPAPVALQPQQSTTWGQSSPSHQALSSNNVRAEGFIDVALVVFGDGIRRAVPAGRESIIVRVGPPGQGHGPVRVD